MAPTPSLRRQMVCLMAVLERGRGQKGFQSRKNSVGIKWRRGVYTQWTTQYTTAKPEKEMALLNTQRPGNYYHLLGTYISVPETATGCCLDAVPESYKSCGLQPRRL